MTLPPISNTALNNAALAETAPDPIITIDESSTILYVNPRAERVFGYSASEMIGQSLAMLIPERLRERHAEGISHYVATGRRRISWQGLRVPVRTKSGDEIPVDISFGEFEWDGRRVFSGFVRDISERVASEREIAEATVMLQQQATELERQVAEAQVLTSELARANYNSEVRAQLAAQSADRARRLLVLSTGLNKALNVSQVAELIIDTGLAAVSADAGTFALITYAEGEAPEFEVIRGTGFAEELSAEYQRFSLRPGRPMSDAVLTRGPVLIESRKDALARYPTVADIGFEAFVALPVMIGGATVAVIGFSFRAAQKFDEPTETFLRTVGGLCGQALERAQLYEERDRRAVHSSFLAEASRLLTSSLDYATTFNALAEAAVPVLADWCIVDVVDNPGQGEWPPKVTRLAVAHQDPVKRAIVSGLQDRVPIDWEAQAGLGPVLLRGAIQFLPIVTDEIRVERARSDEHLAVLRDLAYSSLIRVPLIARERTLGALTLLRSDVGRPFGAEDVTLAIDLAARAATAIDNARLFRDAQQARTVAEAAMARADSASSAKSNFLATMSHEIRTPINAVLGYAELLEMELAGPLRDEQRAQVARIRASAGHLLTLVNEVLDLAKIESGTLRVESHESIAGDTANAALALVAPQAAAKGIAISAGCVGDCAARYVGDADRVRQVLANLLGNAVKFTRPGGSVSLRCAKVDRVPGGNPLKASSADALRPSSENIPAATRGPAGHWVAFRVSDTGVGVPADELESIFEAFVQSESRRRSPYTREQTGTGLGLAISRQLANQMSGEILVESKPGVGSSFTLYMPAA